MRSLKSAGRAVKEEPYLELYEASMKELFSKIINGFQLFSQKSSS